MAQKPPGVLWRFFTNRSPVVAVGLAKPLDGCDHRRVGRVARTSIQPVTSGIIIRTATVAEQKGLEALQLRASLTNDGDREALLANPDAIKIPLEQLAAGRVFVSEMNGAIAGFFAIEPRVDGETELDALFVEPNTRRRGIGRLLVEYCAEVARKQGSRVLHVTGNPHAEDFYLACGFKQIGTIQTRFGVGLLLRREL
jgi:GNAT superfamily N-acetyltransferase